LELKLTLELEVKCMAVALEISTFAGFEQACKHGGLLLSLATIVSELEWEVDDAFVHLLVHKH